MKIVDFKKCIEQATKLPEEEFAANTGLDMSVMDQLVESGLLRKNTLQDFVSVI